MFLKDWSNKQEVIDSFLDYNSTKEERENIEQYDILFACYTYENYSGEAFVLCEKDGILYEINGGHCSCYGLEGQWIPEETSYESIRFRLENSQGFGLDWGENVFRKELIEFLESKGR